MCTRDMASATQVRGEQIATVDALTAGVQGCLGRVVRFAVLGRSAGTPQRPSRYRPGMDLRMSEDERQAFLAGVHIGVISIERADGPPLTVPIWYGYEPGGNLWVTTGTDSLKSKLLHKAQRFSLCVQTEEAPFYSYVSVDGPVVSVEPTDEDGVGRPMAHRYFGAELGDLYIESIKGEASLTWTMRPERWWTVDYSKTGRVDPRTT
jgi:general stress protein 26